MIRLSDLFAKLLNALAVLAALTLLAMVVMVSADIILRNLTRTGFCSPRRGCCAAVSMCGSISS